MKIIQNIHKWGKRLNLGQGQNFNSQLLNAISAQILLTEPQDQYEPIHRIPVNSSSMILRLYR